MLDLLVLGGGVTGLGVARLAARNGWQVTLLERDDLGSGASSATSHMLHGGVRYLEHGQFALVREALAERGAVSRMAPRLARPTRFLLPLSRGSRVAGWKLRAGLALYDLLAGSANLSPHRMVSARDALALEPALAASGLLGAGMYSDAVMDDARLTIAVAQDAAQHGAKIHTRSEVVSVRPSPDGMEVHWRDRESGEDHRAHTRVIVNATGAWCDATRTQLTRMLKPGSQDPSRLLRPTRGVHLVYPALTRSHALLDLTSDGRVLFVIPFAGRALVGTTEVEVDSPPSLAQLQPSLEEVRSLHAALVRVLPGARDLRPLAVFAGVRPLLAASGTVGSASREHRVLCEDRVLTVAGGKYTTFRAMARDVFRAAATMLGRDSTPQDPTAPLPLPPADDADGSALGAHAAGTWARSLPDALRRRSTRWLDDDQGLGIAPAVADAMARRLGWSGPREREELDHHEQTVHEERAWLERALPPAPEAPFTGDRHARSARPRP